MEKIIPTKQKQKMVIPLFITWRQDLGEVLVLFTSFTKENRSSSDIGNRPESTTSTLGQIISPLHQTQVKDQNSG